MPCRLDDATRPHEHKRIANARGDKSVLMTVTFVLRTRHVSVVTLSSTRLRALSLACGTMHSLSLPLATTRSSFHSGNSMCAKSAGSPVAAASRRLSSATYFFRNLRVSGPRIAAHVTLRRRRCCVTDVGTGILKFQPDPATTSPDLTAFTTEPTTNSLLLLLKERHNVHRCILSSFSESRSTAAASGTLISSPTFFPFHGACHLNQFSFWLHLPPKGANRVSRCFATTFCACAVSTLLRGCTCPADEFPLWCCCILAWTYAAV
mmetsp:Transcript_13214/g.21973  ORF Transcript_13214/g.21973 Transcript_13214/m.21973 type:complete len:264 (-) Transcript_13214:113-904(-)